MSFWKKLFGIKEEDLTISNEIINRDEEKEEYKDPYPEKNLLIKLPTENIYDSQFELPHAKILYNKTDLIGILGEYPNQVIYPMDFFGLINIGGVSIYSKIENKLISEVRREVKDEKFEVRVSYFLPTGECFADGKVLEKNP